MRGTGVVGEHTASEPRVLEAVGHAYALGRAATPDELDRLAQQCRPYRGWICALLVSRWMRSETTSGPVRATSACGVRARPAHR